MKKLLLIITVLIAPSLYAIDFSLSRELHSDSVHFRSSAKLEFIHGQTDDLIGWFSFDPDDLTAVVHGELRVDLRTLKTPIEKRDEHMREKHLHTDKFPYAYFILDSTKFDAIDLRPNKATDGQAFGLFYIHGVKREIIASISVRLSEGEVAKREVNVGVSFEIKLDQFKIDRPKALFMKLAETIELELNFTGFESATRSQIELPDWPLLQ